MQININGFDISNDGQLFYILGPCQMQSEEHSFMLCEKIIESVGDVKRIAFKASYDKANRTSISGERGIGIDKSLDIFEKIKKHFGVLTLTDVHLPEHCGEVGSVVDILQIPAFLCRQTDLLVSAANTGKIVNVKKGQFLSPSEMKFVCDKVIDSGNNNVMITERGSTFGYNNLVNDFKGFCIMKNDTNNIPIIYDATHSVQSPGGLNGSSGGNREFVPSLSAAAVATGISGVFMEVHEDPDNAPSDGKNMINVKDLSNLINKLDKINKVIKE